MPTFLLDELGTYYLETIAVMIYKRLWIFSICFGNVFNYMSAKTIENHLYKCLRRLFEKCMNLERAHLKLRNVASLTSV